MRLVEQGSFFQHSYFYASSIADMVGSREEILRTVDPVYKEYWERPYGEHHRSDEPRYIHDVNILLNNINHEPGRDSKETNRLMIFDSSGSLYVELPSKLMQLLLKIRWGNSAPDFDLYKNTLWRARSVYLQNTYYYPYGVVNPYDDVYELMGVSNLVRPKRVTQPAYQTLPNATKVPTI